MARRRKPVKPTTKEQKTITGRLQRKYPQMYETTASIREKRLLSGVSKSDRAALERMIGKKLKKIYRKK